MLDEKNPNYDIMRRLIQMFQFEKLTDAFKMLEGVDPAINSFIKEEMSTRKLSDLKATLL